jgi:heme-degrading monooxygenase HmoA
MITEIALLNIQPGESANFEAAFAQAQKIIASMHGYIEHEFQKCVETADRYLLIVRWQTVEDHMEGFRNSAGYSEWRRLLHHFYAPFPLVEHYEKVY